MCSRFPHLPGPKRRTIFNRPRLPLLKFFHEQNRIEQNRTEKKRRELKRREKEKRKETEQNRR
jgi:hypothetical protein